MRKHLTQNQIKVLRQIYDAAPAPLVCDNKERRTLNVLARQSLITFRYIAATAEQGAGARYYDAIECKITGQGALKAELIIKAALSAPQGEK